MSLTETSVSQIILRQYRYKWNSFFGVITSLIITQMVGILISLGSTSGGGSSSDTLSVNISYFSGDIIISFSFIWALIVAILLTTKAYRFEDFTYVTNRLTSNLSSILFLVSASIVGGITTILSSICYKLIVVFIYHDVYLIYSPISFKELVLAMVVTTLYMILFMSIGYLIGMVGQLHRLFMFVFPPLLLFLLFRNDGAVIESFIFEHSFLLFFIKTFGVSFLFFVLSVIFSNRMEVRV
ncbi:hypothetical protein [Bacillus pinisoli]|uniref:hypothetical protein n=1 Tax=Bacillus pinisoli TaxID=2901866 RepID=UPI001FF25145|nr:hypothetical protein [Bacillus pinisoli]